jgi:HAD superfamily phosphatase (TIGR01668 family)
MNALLEIAKKVLKPREYLEDITSVDLFSLKRNGIKLLLIDINNTILPAEEELPSIRIVHWFQELKQLDFKLALLSNSLDNKRLRAIAANLSVEAYYFVCKPLTFVVRNIIERDFGLALSQTAWIGDQLLGDVLPGNLLEAYTILIKNCDQPLSVHTNIGIMRQAKAALLERLIHKEL